MSYVIIWWVIIQVLAAAALPLGFRLFRHLPDRGYALAKPLGLLLVTYLFWLLGMLGFLRNTTGSIVFCVVVVAAISVYCYYQGHDEGPSLPDFLRSRWKLVLVTELLFLAGFALWALYRAYNPEISATEKPMEFAFLNGILRSDRFPPLDPWLSGFAISYYYFGYMMIAVLTRLSGVPSSIAFNLGIALLFAWTLSGVFSAVYNLVAAFLKGARHREPGATAMPGEPLQGKAIGFGLLGAWVVAVAGNLEGFFEALHTRGLGSAAFWEWLDIKNLTGAAISGGWYPTDNWWWWRASRVIHDRDLLGNSVEVIDEFPFFSFMLGDMHPHVLALPFALVALGLALNLILASNDRNSATVTAGGKTGTHGFEIIFGERTWVFAGYALCIGAIGFLNTWDLPIYFAILVGAYAVRRLALPMRGWLTDTVIVGLALGLLSFALYVPFYLGFQSQAGGILPTLLFSTRWQQYLVMFGLQLFMVVGFLVVRWSEIWRPLDKRERTVLLRNTLALWLGLFVAAFVAMFAILTPLFVTERGRAFLEGVRNNETVRQMIGDLPWGQLLGELVARRLATPWTGFFLALFIAVLIVLLLRGVLRGAPETPETGHIVRTAEPSTTFALWIILIGLLLTFSVEFMYLRDTFGTRMNTVFKFYYQAWILLGIGGVYGAFYVLHGSRVRRAGVRPIRWMRATWAIGLLALLLMSAVYPLLASYNKAGGFQSPPTLDGIAYMKQVSPDDYAAIQWLNANVAGAPVIVEATGGSYSQYGRVSAQTGLPTVLGWGGHELQWRGNYDEAGKREPDIDAIYESLDPNLTLTLLDKYGIKYVYVGPVERRDYPPANLAKFDQLLDVAYREGQVTIYERRR